MTNTELAIAKIDEIIALLDKSDNPLDQVILMAMNTTRGALFDYDLSILLMEKLKVHNEEAIAMLEAKKQQNMERGIDAPLFWAQDAYTMLEELGWKSQVTYRASSNLADTSHLSP